MLLGYYLLFKAASLDGHMAFLVAVQYVIFLLVLILYANLENKFFFFFFFFLAAALKSSTVCRSGTGLAAGCPLNEDDGDDCANKTGGARTAEMSW